MAKYSKGNWRVQRKRCSYSVASTNGKKHFAVCYLSVQYEKDELTQKANAQLISASPDMYEALKKIQKWLLYNRGLTVEEAASSNIQFVKANNATAKALAKAEGK